MVHPKKTKAGIDSIPASIYRNALYRERIVGFMDTSLYRDKAFLSLHLISPGAFEQGVRRMEDELRKETDSLCFTLRFAVMNKNTRAD